MARFKEGHTPKEPELAADVDRTREKEPHREITIEKKTLVMLVGLPASGKSTFAIRHFPLDSIISSDRIRQELTNNPGNQIVSDLAFVLAARFTEERLKSGQIAVIDAQNLSEDTRNRFYQVAEKQGARVEAIFLDVSPEESVRREKIRKKNVALEYITGLRGRYALARRSLEMSKQVSAVHVVKPEETETVHIVLPEDDEKIFRADQEFLQQAGVAERFITTAETGFLKKEHKDAGQETVCIEAGSVLFAEDPSEENAREFLESNFLPHQIINAERIARQLHTKLGDEAVADIMNMILKTRARHNLTTVVGYPKNFLYRSRFEATLSEEAGRRNIEIPTHTLTATDYETYKNVEVTRDAPDDIPAFIVGDIQGCYKAMRELAGNIRRENLARDEAALPRRKIIFVGDMSDRGPHDAEAAIYITALVRSGRAILVKGNHDENLLKGLQGGDVRSAETRETIQELRERLSADSIQKMIAVLLAAPLYAEWKNLVVVHASLPKIPKKGEALKDSDKHVLTHGMRSGRFTGGRADVWKLHHVAAHDPNILVVGGHTHEAEPVLDRMSGIAILDAEVEVKGELAGMYYPELEFAFAREPAVVKLHEILRSGELPTGKDLLLFIEYARQQAMLEVKKGQGEYEGLTLVSYSNITELSNLWDTYPTLRHFRGLIVDEEGNIVARPFKKTHKAGDEVPLDKLDVMPEKVFEKANGSLGIAYFWNGSWRVSTKFSFENDTYTKPSMEMLSAMHMSALDSAKTYLFEIILPDDAHIVDYGGKRELVLLNVVDIKSGKNASWDEVRAFAETLGARTAEDLTARFKDKTVAEIYEYAQEPGNLTGLEGLMVRYRGANQDDELVKVKTREYDDKKFVRDRLRWDKIFERIDPATLTMPKENFEKLLGYNFDNQFARAALEARLAWISAEYERLVNETQKLFGAVLAELERAYEKFLAQEGRQQAIEKVMKMAWLKITALLANGKAEATKGDIAAYMGFVRNHISGQGRAEAPLASLALKKIQESVVEESKKRGKNSFWVVPRQETLNP